MNVDYNTLFQSLRNKQYAPVYCIDGEESYYLDKITDYFENNILPASEKDFNLLVLYGKEAEWKEVKNALMRYPMFSDRQVVILKDADQLKGGDGDLKGLNALLSYVEHPSPTTVFLIEHKSKKVDGKTRFGKKIKEKAVYFTSEKLKEEEIPGWIQSFGREINFEIGVQESQLLAQFLGTDLQKISNEIEKIRINVPNERALTSALIHRFIGISKEYNVFDMPKALSAGNHEKLFKMLAYFTANPKSAPMPLVIGAFYNHFSQLYLANFVRNKEQKEAAAILGLPPFIVKSVMATAQNWQLHRVEQCILLLGHYSTKAVGIKNTTRNDGELLKEMIGRMLLV
jgi:DNA polymerase III subunit delta